MSQMLVVALHVIGACIWVGGHLLLLVSYVPQALRKRAPEVIIEFERRYERIGLPALGFQVVTGLWLLWRYHLWPFGSATSLVGPLKLSLLGITVILALHARLRVFPRLSSATLPLLAWHIALVTVVSVLFVLVGVGWRWGL